MPVPASLEQSLRQRRQKQKNRVKRGLEIFDGLDYPQNWDQFVGQEKAKEQLRASVLSATHRQARMDHTLLASGLHGIGKTTLAYMLAYQAGNGLVQVSGPMDVTEARAIILGMSDQDVLFWDEFHQAVAGNRNRADWMLPFLTDGELLTSQGAEQMPDVTVVAATTDVGKLPLTIVSRFMVRPKLEAYTDAEAVQIVLNLSERMQIPIEPEEAPRIAAAANNNPRDMRMILTAVRDVAFTGKFDLGKAFEWAGLTHDGIPQVAQDILMVLLAAKDHTASLESIQAQLGEPGPMRHYEQPLLQKGYLTVTGRGRKLTDEGVARAELLLEGK